MAATIKVYGAAMKHLQDGNMDWESIAANGIKLSLHTSSYSPNQDTHDYFDDVTNELAGTGGYTVGGFSLTSLTRVYDAGTNEERLDAADLTIAALTPSAVFRYGVIRRARGGAASADELYAYVDFGANQDPGGSDFVIRWASTGIIKFTVS